MKAYNLFLQKLAERPADDPKDYLCCNLFVSGDERVPKTEILELRVYYDQFASMFFRPLSIDGSKLILISSRIHPAGVGIQPSVIEELAAYMGAVHPYNEGDIAGTATEPFSNHLCSGCGVTEGPARIIPKDDLNTFMGYLKEYSQPEKRSETIARLNKRSVDEITQSEWSMIKFFNI
jgi:hypothetical protein